MIYGEYFAHVLNKEVNTDCIKKVLIFEKVLWLFLPSVTPLILQQDRIQGKYVFVCPSNFFMFLLLFK